MSDTDFERLNIILSARDKELAAAIDRNTRRIAGFARNADKGLSNVTRKIDQNAAAAKAAGASFTGFFNISRGGRFVLQNTAAQLGDMAVQFESGTNASRIFAQQLPQIFGGFSALGGALGIVGPLLGTVAAVGIPLVSMLALVNDEADEAGETVETFADKLNAAEAALGRAEAALAISSAGGLSDLEEKYGLVTARVRELADALAEIEVRAAKVSFDNLLDDALGANYQAQMDALLGVVGSAVVNSGTDEAVAEAEYIRQMIADLEAQINQFRQTNQAVPAALSEQLQVMQQELAAVEGRMADMGALADDLLVSEDTLASLAEMRDQLEAARAAGDFVGMANALADVRAALEGASVEIDQGVLDGLVRAEDQARQFANELGQADEIAGDLSDTAAGIADGLSPAVAEAQRLAEWFGISLARAAALAKMGPQGVPTGEAPEQVGRGGDPRQFGGGFDGWNTELADRHLAEWEAANKPAAAPRRGSGGGSGRGGSSASKRKADEVRQYEAAVRALEDAFIDVDGVAAGYRETLEQLKADYDAGKISKDEYSKSVDAVKDAFEAASRRADALRTQAAQTFASIVTNAQSAEDAISNMFANLANQFANAAFGGAFAAIPGFDTVGQLLSFEGGGYTGSGARAGGLDNKGGRMVMVHPNETIIDHTKGGTVGGGGGSAHISIDVSGARGNGEIMEMVQAGVRQGLEQYDRAVLPRSIQKINSDPRRIG